jgi:CubicO group peptidase (beta-lactamase class C family)
VDYARFLHGRLFGPLGMTSADPEFDEAGTWVASSYLRATARDWARFGLLYLRDGVWDGARLLPAGWVDYARTMVSADEDGEPYGAHWWGLPGANPLGTFRASGYEGQSISLCPPLDLVVVRLGRTPYEREDNLVPWRVAMVQAFADAG